MNEAFEITVPNMPKRIDKLICEELEEQGAYVYIHEDDGTTITLNPTASAVFDMCDGQTTAEDMAKLLSETLGVDYTNTLRDVHDILTELSGFGFFQT
ncbi:PqqD family protein [Ghiorsea bivora]|uniref:PqqD family protein n=1 Tax=Ghiorsea bivora TaxID=1485545 RepID=UPI00057010C1|nr:PqqD family protein [Ghiorsea bivora]